MTTHTEFYTKEPITNMRTPKSVLMAKNEYWVIKDSWKAEFEKAVQVPGSLDALPQSVFRELTINKEPRDPCPYDTCFFDVDTTDIKWLKLFNVERYKCGQQEIGKTLFEEICINLEAQAYKNFQQAIGLGIKFEEDAICNVCCSSISYELNLMVACESCNLYVHQLCYGIAKMPEESWKCQTCALGIKPPCILCPYRGGAMKRISDGQEWAHVSCALWIPEVSFKNFQTMEPIIKICDVPAYRWEITCNFCNEQCGACLKCSGIDCVTTFHVICGMKQGYQTEMPVKMSGEGKDELKIFCHIHSQKIACEEDLEEDVSSEKRMKFKPKEFRNFPRILTQKIQDREMEFFSYVINSNIKDLNLEYVSELLKCEETVVEDICLYWKTKLSAKLNTPFLFPNRNWQAALSEANSPSPKKVKIINLVDDCSTIEVNIGGHSSNSLDSPPQKKRSPG